VIILVVWYLRARNRVAGAAGISKEKELSHEQKLASIREFNLKLGLGVATFCGIMSSCFALAPCRNPIKALTLEAWNERDVAGIAGAGGGVGRRLYENFLWCAILNVRNRSYGEYLTIPAGALERAGGDIQSSKTWLMLRRPKWRSNRHRMACARLRSHGTICSRIGGATWYMQFFFYTMGETQMGRYKFSSWTLHMASIIIFSTLWALLLRSGAA